MNLIDCLRQVHDPRRAQGKRYSSVSMLLFIIMAMLRNKFCYREIERFGKMHQDTLVRYLGFRNHRTPSHVSIGSFIKSTDFNAIQQAFHMWSSTYVKIEPGEWINADGKSIRSTASDYYTEYQNFVSLVSLFSAKREQFLLVGMLENKKSNESKTLEDLLEILDLKDVILTMDALHCKKNSSQNQSKSKLLSR